MVAVGIDNEGRKHFLDFALGSSVNIAVLRELMSWLISRGFTCDHLVSGAQR